ncbi:carboxypeptidase regulatory-like domain-containing protein [Bremerella cremea]|uniref:Carboxypeptidase regulatory-like domain-containing protein n=1 Tax=Bremerella cremea TaxID=1031537 RepID=A0A368KRE1_9BACT|nr:carboxypeptidase-like regulatory domain-containing protein [Bremerella cremea]RCS49371.1 carboxypeptidase regulatory-like domain-containing protein [Bremerella cremea]
MIRYFCLTLLAAALATTMGCFGPQLDKIPVTGVVKLEGQPLPNVEVTFVSDSNPLAFGITDENGAYTMATRRYGEGVAPGKYMVKILEIPAGANGNPGTKVKFPSVYSQKGVEVVTVAQDGQTVFEFDLSSKPPKSKGNHDETQIEAAEE